MAEAKLKTKILLKDSLRGMPVGSTLTIDIRKFKIATVRTTVTALKKEGYLFEASDKGCIDHIVVTRLK